MHYVPDNRTEAYQLLPSATVIRRAKDGNVSPEKVSVAVYRVLGSERERITDLSAVEGTLEVGLYDSDGNALEGGRIAPESLVEVTTDTAKISFELKVGGEIVALLDIPVVADGTDGKDGEPGKDGQPGADGENGKDAVVYTLIATPTYVNATPKGYALQGQTVSCSAIKTIGDKTETLDVAQYLYFWEESDTGARGYKLCNIGDKVTVGTTAVRCGFAMYNGPIHLQRTTLLAETEVLYVRMAEPGQPGAKGAIIRVTEWAEGFGYCDGSEPSADGYTYIDIVTMQVEYGRQTRHVCIYPHTSSAENEPVADTETKWWKPMDSTNPIYTPLILADNAKFNFMGTQEIQLFDSDGKLIGRIGTPNRTVCKTLSDVGVANFTDHSVIEFNTGEFPQYATYSLGANGLTRYGSEMENYITINPLTKSMDIWRGRNYGGGTTPIVSFRATPLDDSEVADANTAVLDSLNVLKGNADVVCPDSDDRLQSKDGTIELATFSTKQTASVKLSTSLLLSNSGCNSVEATLRVVGLGGTYSGKKITLSYGEKTLKQEAVLQIENLPAGDWTCEVYVHIARKSTGEWIQGSGTEMGGYAYAGAGSVTAYRNETTVLNTSQQTKEFRARYATNGLLIANSHNDRLLVHDTADGMEFKFQNRNNHGIRVDKDGVFITDSNGVWRSLSQLLSKQTWT